MWVTSEGNYAVEVTRFGKGPKWLNLEFLIH